ncbi:sigma factor [Segatella hominis]|uniref:sigma factor n=1 Tax=Segatella hominis TaxID=2518605 RepID=UPI001C486615|nr:sigma factor [Segatella hominis]WOZ81675.1 sigma factor [Segatella hominis]
MTEENEQRMERLFHDHYEQMYRFAFALLHDNEEARDVVSDGRLPWIASTMT